MAAGIYSLTNLVVGFVGTIATSPLGPLAMPQDASIDVSAAARPGYVIEVEALDGSTMGTISSARPIMLGLDLLPPHFINAVIAAEDERFLEHAGVDPVGIAGALKDTLRGKLRGGSTISQQLAKNTLIGNDRNLERKLVEAMAAIRLHADLGQQEILRRYLQSAWYGRGITGAMQAPQVWFGKTWDQVTLAESATLAAMLKGPNLYDPWKNPEITKDRRDAILKKMMDLGWIGAADMEAAQAEDVRAIAPDTHEASGRWERRAAVADLDERRVVPQTGKARLTIDPAWQSIAEDELARTLHGVSAVIPPLRVDAGRLSEIEAMPTPLALPRDLRIGLPPGSPYNSALLLGRTDAGWRILVAGKGLIEGAALSDPHPGYKPAAGDLVPVRLISGQDYEIRLPTEIEGAIVILDPRTGRILATVGGVDAGLTEFDRTRARRQPGSTIKPFLWLAALTAGFMPDSPVEDIERTWITETGDTWRPRNYDHSQSGQIALYTALERSSNLAAAFLVNRVGVEEMGRRAEMAGVYPKEIMRRHASSALGASETTLRDLVSGFGSIVNDGMPRRPHAIEGIRDGYDLPVPEDFRRPGPVAGRQSLNDLLGMLRGVILRGTASDAFRKHPVQIAGKTGTTQDWRDAWFVGVTPQLAIGVWIGRDDNRPLPNRMAGGTSTAPIASRILSQAHAAGMISASGLIDEVQSSSTDWPPAVHDGRYTTQAHEPVILVPASPAQGRASDTGLDTDISGFWGGLQIQEAGPDPDFNRNGDLLDLLR